MLDANAIATPSHFDARPHMGSAEFLAKINGPDGSIVTECPDEHNPSVPAHSAVAFADLQRRVASLIVENVHLKTVNGQLRTGIRDVEGKMLRLFSELDATIAKLTAAGGVSK